MTETARDLVIVMTRGTDHELSSVAFTIANGGLTAGLKVYAFLTSASVDLVRKRAIDLTHVPPLDPLSALVADFLKRGGVIWACLASGSSARWQTRWLPPCPWPKK